MKTLPMIALASAVALVSACSSDDDDENGDSTAASLVGSTSSLTVTMRNTSESQPMTPPIFVLHNTGTHLFQVTQPASPQVIGIAENGDNPPMVALVEGLVASGDASAFGVGFADPANPGPLTPGMSATFDVDLTSEDQVMSVISMVVCTNDGFSGADSLALPADTSTTLTLPIYDAGSESNVLTLNYWVPPCSADMMSDNITDDENGAVDLHPGQSGSENPAFDFAAGTELLEVTIVRNP